MTYKQLRDVLNSMTDGELSETARVVKQNHSTAEWSIDRVQSVVKVRRDNPLASIGEVSELFIGAPVITLEW